MLLFNRPVGGLVPQMNREPIKINNDDAQYETPKAQQGKYVKDKDAKTHCSFPIGCPVAMQHEDGEP